MNAINERLLELHQRGTPVLAGLVGVGQMGQEILCQVQLMKGMRIPIVVDVTFERAEQAYAMARVDRALVVSTNRLEDARKAIEAGRFVATTDWQLVTALKEIQAVIDATGSPELGVKIALETIQAKKHIVMMNVECDVT
ncbi:MAG TPA: NAD(P)-dependent oxidoreductase, partial [Candidatus Paceibacterota bacterium]|nr:NAD(P)-dependent oxidoreductase [Candidatus Paceibacterota bacterium]